MPGDSWTTESTDEILGLLADSGVALSKRGIQINLELKGEAPSDSTLKNHLDKAVIAGYIENVADSGSWYMITPKGRAYLEGELGESET